MPRRFTIPLLLAAAFVVPRPTWAQSHPASIEIAAEDAADLWSRPNGTGLANDVVRTAFYAVGIEVTFRVLPYARCKLMVVEGATIACFSMSREPDLNGVVLFPAMPIYICYADLVQNPAHPVNAASLRDLPRGTVVGTVLGYEYPAAIQKAVKDGAIVLDEAQSEEMLLRKLAAGRLPLALVTVNDSKSLAYLSAFAHVSTMATRMARVGTLESYIGFSAKHAQGKWAMQKYEEGMHRIAASGELAAITRRWADSSVAVTNKLRAAPARHQ